jgi:hypothetical protein
MKITSWEREVNHIATGRALSPGDELLVGDITPGIPKYPYIYDLYMLYE